MAAGQPLLEIRSLRTYFEIEGRTAKAVDGVDLTIHPNEVFGLVGESGCGKSVTALSIMRLIPKPPGWIEGGEILFEGKDLLRLPLEEMRSLRGRKISMIFQEPLTALNPVFSVGFQLRESIRHAARRLSKKDAQARAAQLLAQVGIPDCERVLRNYPHTLSGGMRQRVMIAMALAGEPKLLIADEPTTALDVTIQAQILELILSLRARSGDMAVLLITHDLAVVAETCSRVAVMYGGKIQESAGVRELFSEPLHPYTQGLLRSLARPDLPQKKRLETIPGTVPDVFSFPRGCTFSTRCPVRREICTAVEPELVEVRPGRLCRCCLVAPCGKKETTQQDSTDERAAC